jgi:hypothetical protein
MLKLELVHEVVYLESRTKEKDDMKIGVTLAKNESGSS